MFSQRTQWPNEQNKLTFALEALKQDGREVIDLTESNPTKCNLKYPVDKIMASLGDFKNILYHPMPFGIAQAREAVSQYYIQKGYAVQPSEVAITASTSESYSLLFRLLADCDDEILVPAPSYPLFEYLAGLDDLKIKHYPLVYDNVWHIDLKALEKAATPKAKILLLVNPNNPTGSYIDKEEVACINQLAKKNKIAIVCDEVFFDYDFANGKAGHQSLVANQENLTFVLNGVSKILGLPQMKIGWVVTKGPEKEVKEALSRMEIVFDTYLSASTPSQNALADWLSLRETIQQNIKRHVMRNRQFIKESLFGLSSCQYLEAQGGWYAVIRFKSSQDEEEWALELLEKEGVFVHPGYFLDLSQGKHIVVSLLLPVDIFQKGFTRVLRKLKG